MGGGGNLNLSCKKIRNGTPPAPPSLRSGPASHKKREPLERRENGKFLDLILSFRGKFVPQWAGMFRTFLLPEIRDFEHPPSSSLLVVAAAEGPR